MPPRREHNGPVIRVLIADDQEHLARILAKLDVRDPVQPVVLAHETGFYPPWNGLRVAHAPL